MTIANADLSAAVTTMDALTTTVAKTTSILTSLKSIGLTEFDKRGSDSYDQGRRKFVVLMDDAIANASTIATSLDANIA